MVHVGAADFGGVRACRAASPLAAVAVCGGGKVCGRDEFLLYELTVKGI